MGIDYRAEFGIGYKVCESDELLESEESEDGLRDYVGENIGRGFESFIVGSGWSGETEGVYLVIEDPFKEGLDLTIVKERLDAEVERLKLEAEGEFGLVGGMYVY